MDRLRSSSHQHENMAYNPTAPEQPQDPFYPTNCHFCRLVLTPETRASLTPCGHANFCYYCLNLCVGALPAHLKTCPLCGFRVSGIHSAAIAKPAPAATATYQVFGELTDADLFEWDSYELDNMSYEPDIMGALAGTFQ